MSGERGLISYMGKKETLNKLKLREAKLIENIEELDFKNSLLSDTLDLD